MKTVPVITLIWAIVFSYSLPSLAEVGVTDSCQQDAKALQAKINDNKDDYTAESRRKAKTQLSAAKTNRLNPAKCRKNILDARAALTKGKQDKKQEE